MAQVLRAQDFFNRYAECVHGFTLVSDATKLPKALGYTALTASNQCMAQPTSNPFAGLVYTTIVPNIITGNTGTTVPIGLPTPSGNPVIQNMFRYSGITASKLLTADDVDTTWSPPNNLAIVSGPAFAMDTVSNCNLTYSPSAITMNLLIKEGTTTRATVNLGTGPMNNTKNFDMSKIAYVWGCGLEVSNKFTFTPQLVIPSAYTEQEETVITITMDGYGDQGFYSSDGITQSVSSGNRYITFDTCSLRPMEFSSISYITTELGFAKTPSTTYTIPVSIRNTRFNEAGNTYYNLPYNVRIGNVTNFSASMGGKSWGTNTVIATSGSFTATTQTPSYSIVTSPAYYGAGKTERVLLYLSGTLCGTGSNTSYNGSQTTVEFARITGDTMSFTRTSSNIIDIVITDMADERFNMRHGNLEGSGQFTQGTSYQTGNSTTYVAYSSSTPTIRTFTQFKSVTKVGRWSTAGENLDGMDTVGVRLFSTRTFSQGYYFTVVGGQLYQIYLSSTEAGSLNNGSGLGRTFSHVRAVS